VIYFTAKPSGPGTFGDSFGAINALFSGLAFAGIIYTIMLQKKELALQRKELADTRKVLARSAKAQEKSEAALKRQANIELISAELSAIGQLLQSKTEMYSSYMQSGHRREAQYAAPAIEVLSQKIEEILKRDEFNN
jgi:hypothetical protein